MLNACEAQRGSVRPGRVLEMKLRGHPVAPFVALDAACHPQFAVRRGGEQRLSELAVRHSKSDCLYAAAIVARDGVYDYAARYTAGLTTWHTPARLSPEVSERVGEIALAAHAALGLADLSRIDVIVPADGEPQVLEASVTPGMTETSLLPMAMQAAGADLGKSLAALVTRVAVAGGDRWGVSGP